MKLILFIDTRGVGSDIWNLNLSVIFLLPANILSIQYFKLIKQISFSFIPI